MNFEIDDTVVANSDEQGLVKGTQYVVRQINAQSVIVETEGTYVQVNNAQSLLQKAE